MTAFTGSWLTKPRLGRQDTTELAIGKVSWSGGALASGDTLTIAGLIPFGENAIIDSVTLFGTIPDTNATQTTGFKIGVTGDDDVFLAATVINQRAQLNLKGTGASIGGAALEGLLDLIITVTANAATGVTSGDLWVEVLYRQRN
jgi:hypothetical protein